MVTQQSNRKVNVFIVTRSHLHYYVISFYFDFCHK